MGKHAGRLTLALPKEVLGLAGLVGGVSDEGSELQVIEGGGEGQFSSACKEGVLLVVADEATLALAMKGTGTGRLGSDDGCMVRMCTSVSTYLHHNSGTQSGLKMAKMKT